MWHMLPRVLFGLLNVWSLLSGKGVLVHVPELETFSLCCPFKVIPKRRTRKNNTYIYIICSMIITWSPFLSCLVLEAPDLRASICHQPIDRQAGQP